MRTYKPGDAGAHIRFLRYLVNVARGPEATQEPLDRSVDVYDDAMGVQVRRFNEVWHLAKGRPDNEQITPELQYRLLWEATQAVLRGRGV